MARPQKAGLNYFPLDTDIDQDDKIALIEAKYGIIGFGIIIKLFKKIYSSNGYYYDWNEQTQLLFSKSIGLDFNKIIEIIDDAIKWNLFDKKLWKTYKILTSKRIQKTYLEATGRRKEVEIIKEYIVNGVNDYINKDNVYIYSKNDDIGTQSKRKEKKVKESKATNLMIAETISHLNKKTGKNFRSDSQIAVKNITARINEKHILEDFKKVIDIKCSHWLNPKKGEPDMSIYLSPDTLFGNKFEKYLNQNASREAIQEAKIKEKEWKAQKDDYEWKPIPPKVKEQTHKVLNIPDRDKRKEVK